MSIYIISYLILYFNTILNYFSFHLYSDLIMI
nr:MAG TPA: hypothetical protein [Caudoviricetes sp.]